MLTTSKFHLQFSSSSVVESNEDLLTEILLRLPVKPLFRFTTVSKHWCAVINNPVLSHRKTSEICKNISGLLVYCKPNFCLIQLDESSREHSPKKTLDFADFPSNDIIIVRSCNGLLCCCDLTNMDLYICNPTTKKIRKLPSVTPSPLYNLVGVFEDFNVFLAFDPRKSPHYKVLCIYKSDQIAIYSSETGIWKHIDTGDPLSREVDFRNGVYWNGIINWFNIYQGDGLYFNLDEECSGKMPMPPLPEGRLPNNHKRRKILYFGENSDNLHLVEVHGRAKTKFNVYEMKNDYSGWFVRYTIDIEMVMNLISPSGRRFINLIDLRMYKFKVLSIVSSENEAESFLILNIDLMAIRYNIGDGTFRVICSIEDLFLSFGVFPYIESISAV